MHADNQIENRGTVTENYPEQLRRLGRRIEDRIDRDLELARRSHHAKFGFGQFAPQFSRAMLDQFDKNFVLGFEMKIESAETDVGLARDICDPRLMISLARNHPFRRLYKIEPSLLTPPIEEIRNLAHVPRGLSHREHFDGIGTR